MPHSPLGSPPAILPAPAAAPTYAQSAPGAPLPPDCDVRRAPSFSGNMNSNRKRNSSIVLGLAFLAAAFFFSLLAWETSKGAREILAQGVSAPGQPGGAGRPTWKNHTPSPAIPSTDATGKAPPNHTGGAWGVPSYKVGENITVRHYSGSTQPERNGLSSEPALFPSLFGLFSIVFAFAGLKALVDAALAWPASRRRFRHAPLITPVYTPPTRQGPLPRTHTQPSLKP